MWLVALQLAGAVVFGLAAALDLLLRRCSAATRRGLWALAIAVALALPATRLALAAPDVAPSPSLAIPLLSLWCAGAVLLLARLVRAHGRARDLCIGSVAITDEGWRESLRGLQARARDRVVMRVSDAIDSPLTAGVLRPVILVPRRMLAASAIERRAVLAHELAHVARADCLVLLAGALARAIYWISPLSWWALRRLRAHAEDAADDAVLRTGVLSSSYAAQLLAIARDRLGRVGRAAADGLRERVRGILDARRPRSRDPRWSVPGVVGVAVLLAALATACEARSGEVPPRAAAHTSR
jgi:beta-lactamase regulating signal transducer with metallopeptidase domain